MMKNPTPSRAARSSTAAASSAPGTPAKQGPRSRTGMVAWITALLYPFSDRARIRVRDGVEVVQVGDAVEEAHAPGRRALADGEGGVLPPERHALAGREPQVALGERAADEAVRHDRQVAGRDRRQR